MVVIVRHFGPFNIKKWATGTVYIYNNALAYGIAAGFNQYRENDLRLFLRYEFTKA
jgi:hypothetical protein